MATQKQIGAIVSEMRNRGLVKADGTLVEGWGHQVGLPLPSGINQYHDNPQEVFRNLDEVGVTTMFRKLSIN